MKRAPGCRGLFEDDHHPVAERIARRGLYLPSGVTLTDDQVAEICEAVSIPVVAIGGIDRTNAADCIRAGAAGVAVIRAATDARALREAIDAAL